MEGNHPYDALDYYPILQLPDGQLENGEKFVHLVIVGFSGMGQALLLEALRVCHYANYDDTQPEADRLRTQITVIDKDMDALLPHFKLMFPHLDSQVDDLHIEYLDAMSRNLLRDELPSYVNQHYEDSIKNPPTSFISILHAYHVEGREMEYNLEATRAQISWINLGENYRWANRYQIEAYQTYLSTLGYAIARQLPAGRQAVTPQQFEERITEEQLHALERMEKHRWNAERTIEGWKTGPSRCDVHRIHHLLVPHHMLSDEQKFKDCQVITQLPYLVELAGFQLYKIC